jgi:hypothetical protein
LLGSGGIVTFVALELTGDVTQIIYPAPDGTYTFPGLQAGDYLVTPRLDRYTFEPTERMYRPLSSVQTGQDFVGRPQNRGGSGEPCFIATAAYGTPAAREVGVLREFRDRYLLTNRVGAAFVRAYYRFSPPVALFIATRASLRTAIRALLAPVVALVKLMPVIPQVLTVIALGILLLASKRRTGFLFRREG